MGIIRYDFIDLSVNTDELTDAIARVSGQRFSLTPLNVKCTYPVFRGKGEDSTVAFVKVGTKEEWRRTVKVLNEVGESGFFAKFIITDEIEYRGYAVFVMEWKETMIIRPEDITEAQLDAFVKNCTELSKVLQNVTEVDAIADSPLHPERLYDVIRQYAARHPLAAKPLKSLLDLPEELRTFGNRKLAVIHGDFHYRNIGFCDDGRMCVFDFDKMTQGLACGDLTHVLIERFASIGLPRASRHRLWEVTNHIVSNAPWPREDFIVACNVLRLVFAARRIMKHPNSVWVPIDIIRRDRKIREFLNCM